MDGIGSVIGAIIAFLLLPILRYRTLFLFALILGAIAIFVILFIREKNSPVKKETKNIS